MIKTKEDLKLYLRKDAERNGISSWLQYRVRLFCGAENACVVRYLRALRHEEYHYNNRGSLYHKIAYAWYKFKTGRYGIKYNLHIGLNMVGYGLRIPHIAGG